jgi:hypothetical protein
MTLPPLTQSALELHLPRDIAILTHQYIIPQKDCLSIVAMGHGELWLEYVDPKYYFWYACVGRHIELMRSFLPATYDDLNDCLDKACFNGDYDIAVFLIDHGANTFDSGLVSACFGEHRELIDLMISHGANNWNQGLYYACWRKNRNLIDEMISRGATYCDYCGTRATINSKLELWHRG